MFNAPIASHATTQKAASVTLLPPAGNYVAAVEITPAFIAGAASAEGTVLLARPSDEHGGSVVTLSSSHPAVSVPASVKVTPGQVRASFPVATTAVAAPVPVTITAAHGGAIRRFQVIVAPENSVTMQSLEIAPARVPGGSAATGTVRLTGPAPYGGARVTLEARRRTIVTVPESVMVPEGSSTAPFVVAAGPLHGVREKTAEVVASYNGVQASATVTVTPGAAVGERSTRRPEALCASLVPCWSALSTPALTTLGVGDGDPPPSEPPALFETRYTLYSPELTLLGETAPSTGNAASVAYEYVWFGGQPLAQIENATGAVAWYFNDHLGTPVRQTDAAGRVVWHAEYEPYGRVYGIVRGEGRHQPLRFPGQEDDGAGEGSYNIFRWYRTGWGRYTQADPIGLRGGLNLYPYADENPLAQVDALGLSATGFLRHFRDLVRWPLGFNDGEIYNDGPVVQDLRGTPMWRDILRQFVNARCDTERTYCANFNYPGGPLQTGVNAGQFVGSFCARFSRIREGQVLVRAWNDWGLESGTRLSTSEEGRSNSSIEGMIRTGTPDWPPRSIFDDRQQGPFRTIRNRYRWIQNVCCN